MSGHVVIKCSMSVSVKISISGANLSVIEGARVDATRSTMRGSSKSHLGHSVEVIEGHPHPLPCSLVGPRPIRARDRREVHRLDRRPLENLSPAQVAEIAGVSVGDQELWGAGGHCF